MTWEHPPLIIKDRSWTRSVGNPVYSVVNIKASQEVNMFWFPWLQMWRHAKIYAGVWKDILMLISRYNNRFRWNLLEPIETGYQSPSWVILSQVQVWRHPNASSFVLSHVLRTANQLTSSDLLVSQWIKVFLQFSATIHCQCHTDKQYVEDSCSSVH